MSSSECLTSSMTGRVEGLAVLPAAPDDADPGPGQDADRVGMSASPRNCSLVDVGRPRVGHPTPVREVHQGGSEPFVARPPKHGLVAFPGLPGRGGRSGQGGEGVIGGKPFPAIADLGQQGGGPDHPRSWQFSEDVLVGVRVEELGDLLFDLDDLLVQRLDEADQADGDPAAGRALSTEQPGSGPGEATEQHLSGHAAV